MFRSRRHLSHWAARVLLLWLFGIGMGMAHACLSTSPPPAAEPAAHHASQQAQHTEGSGCEQPTVKSACQDFCDKSTISIPPLKLALDHAGASALPPPAEASFFLAPAPEPAPRWVPRRDGDRAPPIAIAFLRLAL